MDARDLVQPLVGKTIPTLTGRPNRILSITDDAVIVATGKSPNGQPVPMAWVQEALDRLLENGEIDITVPSVGYRSAFIGAVLATVPGALPSTNPRRIVLSRRL